MQIALVQVLSVDRSRQGLNITYEDKAWYCQIYENYIEIHSVGTSYYDPMYEPKVSVVKFSSAEDGLRAIRQLVGTWLGAT